MISISSGHKIISQQNFFHSATFLPRNWASKFVIWPRLSKLAKFLGLVADDIENGILASQVSSLCKFNVIIYRKIPIISPGLTFCSKGFFAGPVFGGAYFWRGLLLEGI